MKIAKKGRIDTKSVEKSIGDLMDSNNILCSDKHPSIISWAIENEVEHHTFLSKNHSKNKMYHVQNVNSIDNLYERWSKPFYGVSINFLGKYLNCRYSDESTPPFRAKGRHLFQSKVRQSNRPLSSLSKDDIFQS